MYPPPFDYRRPESVDEALSLLAGGRDSEVLAGGHSLLQALKNGRPAPDLLVDVSDLGALRGVERRGDRIRIGALTTYAAFLDAAEDGGDLAAACPAVRAAVGEIGDVQVRNAATLGGNLAHADPASDLTAAVLAAGATFRVASAPADGAGDAGAADGAAGRRERSVAAGDFFVGPHETVLGDAELLTAVELPALGPADAGSYVKKVSHDSGLAMVGVAVRLRVDRGAVSSARVAATGAVDRPTRLVGVEAALDGREVREPDLAADAAERALEGVDEERLVDGVQASDEFRAHLLEVYARRAVERALDRAGTG